MFSKKPNDSEDNSSENSQNQYPEYTPEPAAEPEQSVYEGSSNRINPTKPSIISEGFEFVGTITSEGVLNISGVIKGKVTAKSVLVDSHGMALFDAVCDEFL